VVEAEVEESPDARVIVARGLRRHAPAEEEGQRRVGEPEADQEHDRRERVSEQDAGVEGVVEPEGVALLDPDPVADSGQHDGREDVGGYDDPAFAALDDRRTVVDDRCYSHCQDPLIGGCGK
jgi:hypothetical protein